jgi:nucleotide-binding universal stress UspA family protein
MLATVVVTVHARPGAGRAGRRAAVGLLLRAQGRPILHITSQAEDEGRQRTYRISGQVFFASADRFVNAFDFKEVIDRVRIDVSRAHFWDITAVSALDKVVIKFRREGTEVEVIGLNEASATWWTGSPCTTRVLEMEADARLFVLGEHHHSSGPSKVHLDHHVERVIRSVQCSVLVATAQAFEPPERVVIAFDGSASARKAVEQVAGSSMLTGLPVVLAMVGVETALARRQLEEARIALQAAGFSAETELMAGEPQAVLPARVKAKGPALLVMGAFGHSRLRQLFLGSTTTTLLRLSEVS